MATVGILGTIITAYIGTSVFAAGASFPLQIPISGEGSIEVCVGKKCAGIAKYITLIYRVLIGFAAVLAVLAMTWGGVQWLISRGESGKIQEARKIIGNALVGLLIALLSYAGLWAINPSFVQFGPLTIAAINKIDLDIEADVSSHAALAGRFALGAGVSVSGFTNVKFDPDTKKDVETSGVITQLLADLLSDIDKAGYAVTFSAIVSGHGPGNTFHNPAGRAADITGDRATLTRLADYLGTRPNVNELFYAYNTDRTFNDCNKQGSDWLKNTTYKRKDGTITNLYEAHKDHLHVAVGCGSGAFPKK